MAKRIPPQPFVSAPLNRVWLAIALHECDEEITADRRRRNAAAARTYRSNKCFWPRLFLRSRAMRGSTGAGRIDDLIQLFAEQHPEYGTHEGATGSCTFATCEFIELAQKHGIEVKPFLSKWQGPWHVVVHITAYVGQAVFVDFTSRQFDQDRPYPEIFHGLDEVLEARGDWHPVPLDRGDTFSAALAAARDKT